MHGVSTEGQGYFIQQFFRHQQQSHGDEDALSCFDISGLQY